MEPRSGKAPPADPRDSSPAQGRRAQHAAPSRPQPKHGWSRDRFCEYLRAQRERVALSIEDIARVTKIPERSLRQLEEGKFEELPADVFVRGFLRSYARVVGVNPDEVVRRYAMCGLDPAPVASEFAQVAAEQIAALAEKDPSAGEVAVAKPDAAPAAEEPARDETVRIDSGVDEMRTASAPVRSHGKPKRRPGGSGQRKSGHHPKGARQAGGAPAAASPAPTSSVDEPAATTPAVEAAPVIPRARARRERAFLPPAWSEEETGRRGPLTLAVIILVIVATLTMSYLLRRPSHQLGGDGVTGHERAAATRPS